MKITLDELQTTLYTPNGQVWTLDSKEATGLYYTTGCIFARWSLAEILVYQGEVSTEPYPCTFNLEVGDQVTTKQEAQSLPVRSLILNRDHEAFQRVDDGWSTPGDENVYLLGELDLPATVIWLPEDNR